MGLFDGGAKGDDRIRMVIQMLGHHPDEFESEVMREFAQELLNKAEGQANRWLQDEIAECMRGERARRILKRGRR